MLHYYYHPMLAAARFIQLVLAELEVKAHTLPFLPWDVKESFLALNPLGELPVLVLSEQRRVAGFWASLEYLNEVEGMDVASPLMGISVLERAEIRKVIEWFHSKTEAEVTAPLLYEKVFRREYSQTQGVSASPDTQILSAVRKNLKVHMRYVTHLLASYKWLAGNRFSYADLMAAAHISCLDYLNEIDWSLYPDAKEWYALIKSRPSMRTVLKERVLSIAPPPHYANPDF